MKDGAVMMKKNDALLILKRYKEHNAGKYGIAKIGLFGSLSRGNETKDSDVDVVVKLNNPDLFIMAGIKYDLEEVFQKPVDIITYWDKMNNFLKARIDKEAIYV